MELNLKSRAATQSAISNVNLSGMLHEFYNGIRPTGSTLTFIARAVTQSTLWLLYKQCVSHRSRVPSGSFEHDESGYGVGFIRQAYKEAMYASCLANCFGFTANAQQWFSQFIVLQIEILE